MALKAATIVAVVKTDFIYNQFSYFYDHVFAKLLRQGLELAGSKIPPDSSVLELGIGSGGSIPFYPTGTKLTALDISADMLKQAKSRLESRPDIDGELLVGDATDTGIRDKQYDVVVSFSVISVVDNPKRLINEALRLCKPGGKVLIIACHQGEGWIQKIWSVWMDFFTKPILGFTTKLRNNIYNEFSSEFKIIEFYPTNYIFGYSLSELVVLQK